MEQGEGKYQGQEQGKGTDHWQEKGDPPDLSDNDRDMGWPPGHSQNLQRERREEGRGEEGGEEERREEDTLGSSEQEEEGRSKVLKSLRDKLPDWER